MLPHDVLRQIERQIDDWHERQVERLARNLSQLKETRDAPQTSRFHPPAFD